MRKKILFVSHCVLNTASKVDLYDTVGMEAEESLRTAFVRKALESGIQIVQLPCPEFTLYGTCRWGNVSGQFDNSFFRSHCEKILAPIILQLREYIAHAEKFEVLGIIGIDGSPSCGVDMTCFGDWGGDLGNRPDIARVIDSVRMGAGNGVFFDVLRHMLAKEKIELPIIGLNADAPEKLLDVPQWY
jgi:predicted secreted protein